MIRQTLTYGGVLSSDYNLYISGESTYNAPARVYDMQNVPGRNGQLAIDQGRYENIEVSYPAYIWKDDAEEFAEAIAAIRDAFCIQTGYQRLVDTYNPDEYRLGIYKAGLEVSPSLVNRAGEMTLTFDCKPQRFLIDGETEQAPTSGDELTNPTGYPARPLLKATGNGTIGIGSDTITIAGASSAAILYIDCDLRETYTVSGGAITSANQYITLSGTDYPELPAGDTGITFTTSALRITPRWWRL